MFLIQFWQFGSSTFIKHKLNSRQDQLVTASKYTAGLKKIKVDLFTFVIIIL